MSRPSPIEIKDIPHKCPFCHFLRRDSFSEVGAGTQYYECETYLQLAGLNPGRWIQSKQCCRYENQQLSAKLAGVRTERDQLREEVSRLRNELAERD